MLLLAIFLSFSFGRSLPPPLSPVSNAQLKRHTQLPRPSHSVLQVVPSNLPKSFDFRVHWPQCVSPVLDQGQCGSCWAFASTEVLSDRYCIATGKKTVLSPQYALECEPGHWGCAMGSMPELAWRFLRETGSSLLSCNAYKGKYTSRGCEKKCDNGDPLVLYKALNSTQVGDFIRPSHHVAAIMAAVLQGPLDATFLVYSDFDDYVSGTVYEHKYGGFAGIHSVKIIGYGTLNSTDFWLVQNSWGRDWGDNGFFMMKRGVDECMFESQVFTGWPLVK